MKSNRHSKKFLALIIYNGAIPSANALQQISNRIPGLPLKRESRQKDLDPTLVAILASHF
jgi:hypothetical protein